jgi:predicted HicB family RNase H-like nuclease
MAAKTFQYCGFSGSIEYSPEDDILHGKLVGIRDLVSYDGVDLATLETNFRGAVNEYIDFCKAEGKPRFTVQMY